MDVTAELERVLLQAPNPCACPHLRAYVRADSLWVLLMEKVDSLEKAALALDGSGTRAAYAKVEKEMADVYAAAIAAEDRIEGAWDKMGDCTTCAVCAFLRDFVSNGADLLETAALAAILELEV